MTWATEAQVRLVSGLTTSHISQADVVSFISLSDREVAAKIFEYYYDEVLEGSITGSNTLFQTRYKPIADKDQSGSVSAGDVTVYGMSLNSQGFEVSTSLSVSSVSARDGVITLSSAPAATYFELRVDYATIDKDVNMNDVYLASSFLAALMAMINIVNAKFATAPYSYTAGGFSITKPQGTREEGKMQELWEHYQELLDNVIQGSEIQKVRPRGSVLDKGISRGYGTTGGTIVSRNQVGDGEPWA